MEERALLVVDDETHILNSLKRLLRKEPYRVHIANSGAEGLEVLAEHPVQVVMTDQRMPQMTGTEFLQRVKESWPETIRVVLSGYAEADVVVGAINQGEVYRFIGKPWNDEALKFTIRQCFEHYDIVTENRALQEQTKRQVVELEKLNKLLKGSVAARTRSLAFSQELVEALPVMVLGVSAEGDFVFSNDMAREQLAPVQGAVPGTPMADVLPPDLTDVVRDCLANGGRSERCITWDERRLHARTSFLGEADQPRGCVVMIEDEDDEH